jgi:DNA-binding GntR family transcriptional regulator
MSAFMQARSDSIMSAASRARYDSSTARKATISAHGQICEAIEARNVRRAYELMTSHVRGSASPLLESLVETAASNAV